MVAASHKFSYSLYICSVDIVIFLCFKFFFYFFLFYSQLFYVASVLNFWRWMFPPFCRFSNQALVWDAEDEALSWNRDRILAGIAKLICVCWQVLVFKHAVKCLYMNECTPDFFFLSNVYLLMSRT